MEDELFEDLKAELSVTDENFNEATLLSKIKGALREIRLARRYPSYYTESQVKSDMESFYSNARKLALYDYNLVGAEGQESHGENGVSRSYTDRNKNFAGVIPLARL